jgi:hypothetical protein
VLRIASGVLAVSAGSVKMESSIQPARGVHLPPPLPPSLLPLSLCLSLSLSLSGYVAQAGLELSILSLPSVGITGVNRHALPSQ